MMGNIGRWWINPCNIWILQFDIQWMIGGDIQTQDTINIQNTDQGKMHRAGN